MYASVIGEYGDDRKILRTGKYWVLNGNDYDYRANTH